MESWDIIELVEEAVEKESDIIEDGFGTYAPVICPTCGYESMYVNRPGDIRCGVCYDNNPKEWYTGTQCSHCGMRAVHDGICVCCVGCSCRSKQENLREGIIEDGFGNAWSAWCPECGQKTMCIVRPGKVQCNNCEG